MQLRYKFVVYLILIFFVLICKPSITNAQVFFSAQSEGAGDTGRASFDPVGSHFLNPAALPFLSNYNLGGTFQMNRPETDSPSINSAFVVTDNSGDVMVSASLGYVYKRQSFTNSTIIDQDFSIALAGRVLPRVSLGVFGHRLVRQNNNGPSWTKHNVSAGVLFVAAGFLNLSVVAYDMLNDEDLDMIPVLALGSELNVMGVFKFKTDVTRQEKRNPNRLVTLNSGLEFDLGEGFAFRTGGIWDTLNVQTYWCAGLGWLGPRLSAAYAYKSNINVARDVAHSFQLWVNF